MNRNSFNQYLNEISNFCDPALALLLSQKTSTRTFQKNQIIYQKGKIPDFISFISKGNAIALMQPKPNRRVLRFWTEQQLICPSGFFNHLPTAHSVVALEDCRLICLHYRELYRFLNKFPEAYSLVNDLLREEIESVKRVINGLATQTPQDHEALLLALEIEFNEN